VAAFLGSPPMNLMEGKDCLVGFRPEHFLPKEAFPMTEAAPVPFRVTRLEYLGADRLLYGVLERPFPEQKVIARLPSTVSIPIQPGERYEFVVQEKDLRFFDRDAGHRTEARPLAAQFA